MITAEMIRAAIPQLTVLQAAEVHAAIRNERAIAVLSRCLDCHHRRETIGLMHVRWAGHCDENTKTILLIDGRYVINSVARVRAAYHRAHPQHRPLGVALDG